MTNSLKLLRTIFLVSPETKKKLKVKKLQTDSKNFCIIVGNKMENWKFTISCEEI